MNKKITAAAIAAVLSIGTIASVSTAHADRGHGRGDCAKPVFDKDRDAMEAVITSTLGITAADLQAARIAGKSLATVAGDKKAALVTALVNFKTTEIDAAVTAGKLTAEQATKMKSDLTARVTAMVESVPGPKHGGMGKDKMGKGKKMHSPSNA